MRECKFHRQGRCRDGIHCRFRHTGGGLGSIFEQRRDRTVAAHYGPGCFEADARVLEEGELAVAAWTAEQSERPDPGAARPAQSAPVRKYPTGDPYLGREQARASPGHEGMMAQRAALPFAEHQAALLRAVDGARVTIVYGETGSGKSTQMPQFVLDEAIDQRRPARIFVTQPRRIAALSLAQRVASERSEEVGASVGYQVRHDTRNPQQSSHIIFMTSGVLLRRLQTDAELAAATHVVLDEVHERDLYVDLSMAVLRRLVQRRGDLKVIVMSATMQVGAFHEYFGAVADTAKYEVPGRMFPVVEHYVGGTPESDLPVHAVVSVLEQIEATAKPGGVLIFVAGLDDINSLRHAVTQMSADFTVIPLHSSIPSSEQRRLFDPPRAGTRKVVISTNIAETSVTVPDIAFVIDTGRIKQLTYDPLRRVAGLKLSWVTQASAKQRRGRAGRVCEGECFRIYDQAFHDGMEPHPVPEIRRSPLEGVVLQIRFLRLADTPQEFLCECLDPPTARAVAEAEAMLRTMGAVDDHGEVTPLGRLLVQMPMHVTTAKMLVLSAVFDCVDPVLTISAAQDAGDLFMIGPHKQRARVQEAAFRLGGTSDHLAAAKGFREWEARQLIAVRERQAEGRRLPGPTEADRFARDHFLSFKALRNIRDSRRQVAQVMGQLGFDVEGADGAQCGDIVRAVVCGGLYPNIAFGQRTLGDGGLLTKTPQATAPVFNNASACYGQAVFSSPFFAYSEVRSVTTPRGCVTFLRDITNVSPVTVLLFGGPINKVPGGLCSDGWLHVPAQPRAAELACALRKALDRIIEHKVQRPGAPPTPTEQRVLAVIGSLVSRGSSSATRTVRPAVPSLRTYGFQRRAAEEEGALGDDGCDGPFGTPLELSLEQGRDQAPVEGGQQVSPPCGGAGQDHMTVAIAPQSPTKQQKQWGSLCVIA